MGASSSTARVSPHSLYSWSSTEWEKLGILLKKVECELCITHSSYCHVCVSALETLPIILLSEELFSYNLKLCSYSFSPIIELLDPILNSALHL